MRRVKYVLVTEDFLGAFVTKTKDNRAYRVIKSLPKDAEFLYARYSDNLMAFRLFYSHPSFEEVKEGNTVPEFECVVYEEVVLDRDAELVPIEEKTLDDFEKALTPDYSVKKEDLEEQCVI